MLFVLLAWLIAQQVVTDPTDWVSILQTGGTAGLILMLILCVVAFLRGWVVSGTTHQVAVDAAVQRINKLEAELATERQARLDREVKLGDTTVPLLREVARALPDAIAGVEAVQRKRDEAPLDIAVRRLELLYDTWRAEQSRPDG